VQMSNKHTCTRISLSGVSCPRTAKKHVCATGR
jgi:hypothetical protein